MEDIEVLNKILYDFIYESEDPCIEDFYLVDNFKSIILDNKIKLHFENASSYEVAYVFVKGFGNAFPYLRASRFMSNFEGYIKGYKLIMFYPGEAKNYYSLFGLLKDENLYRAIKLINE